MQQTTPFLDLSFESTLACLLVDIRGAGVLLSAGVPAFFVDCCEVAVKDFETKTMKTYFGTCWI